jgi:DNA polymerase III subunit delta'
MAKSNDDLIPESDALSNAPHPRMASDLFGQDSAERELLDSYRSGKLPHAWIFGGEKGIGKATLAWRFAKFILSYPDSDHPVVKNATSLAVAEQHPVVQRVHALGHGDLHILRREWNDKNKKHYSDIRADDVRSAVHIFQQAASEGGYRIVILDNAEDLNGTSANALLKMIEEPPQKSLFLIISHRPNQILPTIRSRCRRLILRNLSEKDCMRVLKSFYHQGEERDVGQAVSLARGSVYRALKLLGGKSLDVHMQLERLLLSLPEISWIEVHNMADHITGRGNDDEFETWVEAIQDFLYHKIQTNSDNFHMLKPWADVWSLIEAQMRETEILNLDRRSLVLNVFSELAKAAQLFRAA